MRTRLLLCLLILLSCVKRISPDPGDARTTYTGVPLRFGESQQVPEGTEILWDFGDGTAQGQGASVVHAFPRAGVYTVVETIRDKDGQMRTARTHVTALERTVAMAVPGDARAALLIPAPWARLVIHREVAAKLSLGASLDELARSLGAGAGFDVLDPRAAEANGFDPQKGIAFFTVPQDPEALVFAIGSSDEKKSLAAARQLLGSARTLGRYGGGPFQLGDATLPDGTPILVGRNATGETVALLQRQGYLYLRLAGATDPARALASAAAIPPGKGLAADPGFLTAVRHVGSGDAVFYSREGDRGAAGSGRLSGELGASAFTTLSMPRRSPHDQPQPPSQTNGRRIHGAQSRGAGLRDLAAGSAALRALRAPALTPNSRCRMRNGRDYLSPRRALSPAPRHDRQIVGPP